MGGDERDHGYHSASSDYESFGDKVNVEVTDLVSYFQEMSMLAGEASMAAQTATAEMSMMISQGLQQGDGGQVFAEGVYMANALLNRLSQLQHFIGDVTEGVSNIGAAAAVIAEIYENADSENAASVSDIAFAYADPSSGAPAGFRPVTTLEQERAAMAAATGEELMAASADVEGATASYRPATGVVIYTFPDGSTRQVATSVRPGEGPLQSSVNVTTSTVYGPDATRRSTTTEQSYWIRGTNEVRTTAVTSGDDRNGRTSTTTTTTASDGSMTVTSETVVTSEGQRGEPVTTTTQVPANQHNEPPSAGPVSDAADNVESDGEDWFVQVAGPVRVPGS